MFHFFKKKEVVEVFDQEKLDLIIEYLKNKYSKPVYKIKLTEESSLTIFDSKLGGLPYIEKESEYPKDSKGNPLILLAQINFEKEKLLHITDHGMLQFFISSDDCYGINFDDFTKQDTFKIIYHPTIHYDMMPIQVKTNTSLDNKTEAFPFYKQYSLQFIEEKESIGMSVEGIEDVLKEAVSMVCDEEMTQSSIRYFSHKEYDYLFNELNTWSHKMLGYPAFTQTDPRGIKYSLSHYDTLLLQIDSKNEIMWGDSGICNFFINHNDLKQLKFDDVIYNWDCY